MYATAWFMNDVFVMRTTQYKQHIIPDYIGFHSTVTLLKTKLLPFYSVLCSQAENTNNNISGLERLEKQCYL